MGIGDTEKALSGGWMVVVFGKEGNGANRQDCDGWEMSGSSVWYLMLMYLRLMVNRRVVMVLSAAYGKKL